jgi:hypothetical protein
MNGLKATVLSLLAVTAGVFAWRKMRGSGVVPPTPKKQADDALVDFMSEQSFPASDAPAY